MATCEMYLGSVGSVWKKSRSPGAAWLSGTAGPVSAWSAATRGMTTPARANDHCTRPEQSNTFGPLPPQTYGSPSRLCAALSIVMSSALLSVGYPLNEGTVSPAGLLGWVGLLSPVARVTPARPAAPEAFSCDTSGSTV